MSTRDDRLRVGPTAARRVRGLGSVRARMVALSVLLLLSALAASLLTTSWILERRLDQRLERELAREAEEFAALARGVDPATGEPFADVERIFDVFLQHHVPSRDEALLTFVDGEPFRGTSGQPAARLDRRFNLTRRWAEVASMERGTVEVDGPGTVHYRAVPVRVEGATAGVLVIARLRDVEAGEIDQVVWAGGLLGALMVALAGLVVWRTTGRVLRPVDEVSATARAISETDLSRRVDGGGHDEIGRLVATVNDMLDRLQAAFETQREFVDDAGHELRTPITIVRGNLDLLNDEDPEQRAAALALVNGELDRVQRMVDDLLLLARAERPDFVHPAPLDLDELTVEVIDKARALGRRDWVLDEADVGVLVADRHRVTQALLQLAQNAVQHTGPGQRISIGSRWRGEEAELWVADAGPGIPPGDAERVMERFRRGRPAPTRAEGAGLGLAIVSAIARAHGGRVLVGRSAAGGARLALVLPADPRARHDPDTAGTTHEVT